MPNQFVINLCNPKNHNETYDLIFDLYDTEIVKKWQDKVLLAKSKYPIDDPQRFYGMRSLDEDKKYAIDYINLAVDTINSHEKIIDRHLTNINDTDTLNYLHHIFEEYHGLLDQQNTEFWKNAPDEVRKAIANLNIAVHRVESVLYNNKSRFVVTYYGLPKTDTLDYSDYNNMTCEYKFGELYLNYVEIGKTLEDLMRDNDQYIHDDAFQPWTHYSADFNVKLFDISKEDANEHKNKCWEYYRKNRKFFENIGYHENDIRLQPGKIKLGQLNYNNKELTLENIKKHQYVKDVMFSA